jgi:hypothetical protein
LNPSRYFDYKNHDNQFGFNLPWNEKKKFLKDPEVHYQKIFQTVDLCLTKTAKEEFLKKDGYTWEKVRNDLFVNFQSPFWKLKCFRRDFFLKAPPCEIHMMRLGIGAQMITNIGIKLGKSFCKGIS